MWRRLFSVGIAVWAVGCGSCPAPRAAVETEGQAPLVASSAPVGVGSRSASGNDRAFGNDRASGSDGATAACRASELALEVLGSGGPIPDDARASSGYLVWREGKARVLVDAGGGVFLRFAESGASLVDLEAIAISHLHADHVASLPALLKGGYFADRKRALVVVGPSNSERFPAIDEHLRALFDPDRGAYRYLSGYLDGEGLFPLTPVVVDVAKSAPTRVFDTAPVTIDSVGVHHGQIPALGFLVTVGQHKIAFTGDQSADNVRFTTLATDADLLVAHHALPERGFDGVRHLHRTPGQIGELAAAAKVKRVVLSHHMRRALRSVDEGVAAVAAKYAGPVDVADDHSCYVLAP